MVRLNALIAAFVLLIAGSAAGVAGGAPAGALGAIQGHAWTANNSAIPHARLRLRDITTGRIAAVTQANENGQFAFGNVAAGSYAVELVNASGSVLAIGHLFSVASGESVVTFVRLAAPGSWFSGFFANAAAAVASSAASQGITALAPAGRPASAGR
ncbi:MAG TPA: carboxypeptidase-like regulatory domain-containing protein [Vicinamibacterales bacterium]|nr:carboxypeptidase-like regulatory domain-containing protein [Vicinamibacterales bacterium]